MVVFWWLCLLVVFWTGSSAEKPNFGTLIQDLQTKLEAMEARNTKLRAELSNVKSENAALKSRLDAGISKAKVENSEMKTRLSPETKQASSDTLFLATISEDTVSVATGSRIIYDQAVINPGGNYNPEQGAYTAPLNGYYQFTITKRSDYSQAKWWLLVDEIRTTYFDMDYHEQGSGTANPTSSATLNLYLTAGQIVRVENEASSLVYGSDQSGVMFSWFTGFLVFSL